MGVYLHTVQFANCGMCLLVYRCVHCMDYVSRCSVSVEGGGDATSPGKPITPPWEVRWCPVARSEGVYQTRQHVMLYRSLAVPP